MGIVSLLVALHSSAFVLREILSTKPSFEDESKCRHGGAFMVPEYGCGELPQAFCRVAAVQAPFFCHPLTEVLHYFQHQGLLKLSH